MKRRYSNWQRIKHHPLNYLMSSLLRLLMTLSKGARTSTAGFVLPTTVLLLLVVSLTMGALSFRSFSRVEKTIAFRDQQIIDGFAAPAIDRAKSKLEYLFTQDERVASKRPPSSNDLFNALIEDVDEGAGNDPYTLPDETAIDINNDGDLDPAWEFPFDDDTTVVYSLLVSHERDPGTGPVSLSDDDTQGKADALVTRNAPISTAAPNGSCPVSRLSGDGWQDAGGNLQKNFQVNVLAIKGSGGPNRTVSAAEYQQVRSSPKGNKYGAYFRYDLDISPGDPFRWNGAMHSESNIIAGRNLDAYLVSAPESCIFSLENSEITISEAADDPADADTFPNGYKGNLVAGLVRDNTFQANGVRFHNDATVNAAGNVNVDEEELEVDNDSIDKPNNNDLDDVFADPVQIFTEDATEALNPAGFDFENRNVDSEFVGGRVRNFAETDRPILDDGYRADDRYGPKPRYDDTTGLDGRVIGEPIPNVRTNLKALDPANGAYGLDGYWERRAVGEGLRVVVGQRLELGNRFGWGGSDEPLYPSDVVAPLSNSDPKQVKGASEAKQQRTLRDNLAAVQGMVVYHASEGGEFPYMCVASTVHPGTQQSLINSRTFDTYPLTGERRVDFLTGQGTNGWEFNFRDTYGSEAVFAANVRPNRPLGRALRNLAHLAGDPQGGAPSFEPVQGIQGEPLDNELEPEDEVVHPYPYLAMWGDFSGLRRILFSHRYDTSAETELVNTVGNYNALSPADKSTLHSAACTLGMLAYNLKSLERAYNAVVASPALTEIETALGGIGAGPVQASEWLDELADVAGFTRLEEAEILALYRQVVRDRLYGFELGPAPADCGTLPSNTASAFCSPDQIAAYPSLFYLFPATNHNQDGSVGGAVTQTGEYIDESALNPNERYIFDPNPGSFRVNDDVTYEVISTTGSPNVAELDLPALDIGSFRQETATATDLVAPNDFDTGSDEDIRASLTQSEIKVSGTVYELSFLDKALLDGRQGMNVRVLDLDIGKLTLDTPFDGGTVAWIPESSGIFYAAREDAVREDSIVRPRRTAADWATCKVFENLVDNGQGCPMGIETTDARQFGTYDPPLNADNSISPKPVDMYPDPDRRPHGFRLFNGYNLNRSDDPQAAGISFVTDNPAYIYGDFNWHQEKANAAVPPADPNIIEEFEGAGQLLGTVFADGDTDEDDAKQLFYGRTDLDERFARADADTWRPSEIFADAVTILSTNFRDGWVEDAFIYEIGNAQGNPPVASSYLNYNRADLGENLADRDNPDRWLREDNVTDDQCDTADGGDCSLPIRFSRNGIPQRWRIPPISAFEPYPTNFDDDFIDEIDGTDPNNSNDLKILRQKNQVTPPDNVRVNALLIAGIVPMRQDQTYGGIQNFPRLLEYWRDKNLIISGGFFQLNFSTQSTGPQDQDAWEPGSAPIPNQNYNLFYNPANRIWGYDVGFQYTSVAPVAQRFIRVGRPRSEYYRELPLDDPYVQNLCTALQAADDRIESCQ